MMPTSSRSRADRSFIPNIEPRDILAPIATLCGLLTAALGILSGAGLEKGLFHVLVNIIVLMILLFVITAVLTTLATWTRRTTSQAI